MKWILLFALSLPSFASTDIDKRYKCIVRGVYDEEDYEFIFGPFEDTVEQAAESAMNECKLSGYPYCQLIGCR